MIVWDQDAGEATKIRRYLWMAAFFYLTAHLLVLCLCASDYPGDFLVIALGLLKVLCCVWLFGRLVHAPVRFRWLLVALGGLLYNISNQIYVWGHLLFGQRTFLSGTASFFIALASIPNLLSISLNFDRKDPVAVRLIDAAMCAMLSYLFFSMLFMQAGVGSNVVSTNLLIDYEDGFLMTCAAVRFFAAETAEDRRFFYVFFLYIAVSTPVIAIRNRGNAAAPTVFWDLALDVPPMLFLLLAMNPPPAWVRNLQPSDRIVGATRGGSPVFIGLALTLLGIAVSRSSFYLGSASIFLGVVAYGLRNAIVQGRLLQTEGRLLLAQKDLELQASRDGLTGIPNRRLFDQTLRREWRDIVQRGGYLALLMIDVDCFKDLNDVYGHQSGDDCLVSVAVAIQAMLPRAGDFVGRYGGEEFAVILPGASLEGVMTVAERLRTGVAQLAIPHVKSNYKCVTISIGAAVAGAKNISDLNLLLKAADEALYRAKRGGRNRIETVDLTVSIAAGDLSKTMPEP